MTIKKAGAFLLTLASLMHGSALAGVVYEVETTLHSGSSDIKTSHMSVEQPNLKMEVDSFRDSKEGPLKDVIIFRGDSGKMIVINHEEQYYMEMDPDTITRIGGQVSAQMDDAMQELNKQLEDMKPEQRAMMEKMLKGKLGDSLSKLGGDDRAKVAPLKPAEFLKTGERATKQGYPCVKYDVLRSGEKVQELWVTDWNNVKGSEETAATFEDMAEFFEEMMAATRQMAGGFGVGLSAIDASAVDIFNGVNGFPVVTRSFKGGELESETVLKSVSEKDFDVAAFAPPKGYKLRTIDMK